MKTPLRLPDRLKGPWEHALFLTYGADAPFFERTLWRQLGDRCRNKIILADGPSLLDSSAVWASSPGMVRHLNQRYIGEGIFGRYAAHAKAILLTNSEQGRLLVGSGNLGWQGYASGGEIFVEYEYDEKTSDNLGAFIGFQEFVDGLRSSGFLSQPAISRIDHLTENTPWLYRNAEGLHRPVCNNAQHSFLDQLQSKVANRPVEELWILSPFVDAKCIALRHMLEILQPKRAVLLAIRGQTSVCVSELESAQSEIPSLEVREAGMANASGSVHAKFYLIKLAQSAICLVGSPNLSQVAMLRSYDSGNIELANILSGERDEFDHLLEPMEISKPIEDLGSLELVDPTLTQATPETEDFVLCGAEWDGTWLLIAYQGDLPSDMKPQVALDGDKHSVQFIHNDGGILRIKLPPEFEEAIGNATPLCLVWGDGEEQSQSNPVYACNRLALDRELQMVRSDLEPNRVAGLDIEDEDLEKLLAELEATLVIDERSIWQLAGRADASHSSRDDEDDASHIRYEDIDYDSLRRHPRIRQYTQGRGSSTRYGTTRLGQLLAAITDHFRGLVDGEKGKELDEETLNALRQEEDPGDSDSDAAELAEEQRERERKRQSFAIRRARMLRRFIGRYVEGLASSAFIELVGPDVMIRNCILFSQFLWIMLQREWLEPAYIVDAFLHVTRALWGSQVRSGALSDLSRGEPAYSELSTSGTSARILAGLYEGARASARQHELRFRIRGQLRSLLLSNSWVVSAEDLAGTQALVAQQRPYEGLSAMDVITELSNVASYETRDSFLRSLENELGVRSHSCRFHEVKVHNPATHREERVNNLVMKDRESLSSLQCARAILSRWMTYESLPCYRVSSPDSDGSAVMVIYWPHEESGDYWIRDAESITFGATRPVRPRYKAKIEKLGELAKCLVLDSPTPSNQFVA